MAKSKKQINSKTKATKLSKKELVETKDEFDDDNDFSENQDEIDDEQNQDELDENAEFDDTAEFDDANQIPEITHKRSNGLFNNPWWKRGLLKGFIVWLIFVVFFYLMDFIGLVEVIDRVKWFFFLILLIILGMAWEKILYKFIKI